MRYALFVALICSSCGGGLKALYPPRPAAQTNPLPSDPPPSRLVVHVSILRTGLEKLLDDQLPKEGTDNYSVLGASAFLRWTRGPVSTSFRSNRVAADTDIVATISSAVGTMQLPLHLHLDAEPVINSSYQARLQAPEVQVTSTDARLRIAQGVGGALDKLRGAIETKIKNFTYDLRPALDELHAHAAKPIAFQVGDTQGCADLRVLGVEAGPTILADGIEKDLALVVAPSVKLPCSAESTAAGHLPPLANVTSLPSGPFSVTVPVVARYEELSRAMTQAFTDGKLYFSKTDPKLYLEKPEIYPYRDQLVVKLHLHGPIQRGSIHSTLDGNLFLIGHPQLSDNELTVPDLEPTIETSHFLLNLAANLDGDTIRREARQALKLDLSEQLTAVRDKLSTDTPVGAGPGCLRTQINRIEIGQVYAHAQYLRLYVTLTGQGSLYIPCPSAPPVNPLKP